ncbi:hypothetical protein V5799_032447 [Amblyomma americanum]|uniref:PurM-like N-terminal domain-containing protein n=1 Tax=Amblyomma americanum TaxID=6943 RepID=A0AAQ4DR55_AMBAM
MASGIHSVKQAFSTAQAATAARRSNFRRDEWETAKHSRPCCTTLRDHRSTFWVPLGDSGYSLDQTIDYFYPSIEDTYLAGKIACANVLSDLYALGVTRCDNVLMVMAASTKLTEKQRDIVVPILIRGVKDLAEQAGTRSAESEIILPDNAQPGDVLALTKPLDTQVSVNAHQWLEKPERHA